MGGERKYRAPQTSRNTPPADQGKKIQHRTAPPPRRQRAATRERAFFIHLPRTAPTAKAEATPTEKAIVPPRKLGCASHPPAPPAIHRAAVTQTMARSMSSPLPPSPSLFGAPKGKAVVAARCPPFGDLRSPIPGSAFRGPSPRPPGKGGKKVFVSRRRYPIILTKNGRKGDKMGDSKRRKKVDMGVSMGVGSEVIPSPIDAVAESASAETSIPDSLATEAEKGEREGPSILPLSVFPPELFEGSLEEIEKKVLEFIAGMLPFPEGEFSDLPNSDEITARWGEICDFLAGKLGEQMSDFLEECKKELGKSKVAEEAVKAIIPLFADYALRIVGLLKASYLSEHMFLSPLWSRYRQLRESGGGKLYEGRILSEETALANVSLDFLWIIRAFDEGLKDLEAYPSIHELNLLLKDLYDPLLSEVKKLTRGKARKLAALGPDFLRRAVEDFWLPGGLLFFRDLPQSQLLLDTWLSEFLTACWQAEDALFATASLLEEQDGAKLLQAFSQEVAQRKALLHDMLSSQETLDLFASQLKDFCDRSLREHGWDDPESLAKLGDSYLFCYPGGVLSQSMLIDWTTPLALMTLPIEEVSSVFWEWGKGYNSQVPVKEQLDKLGLEGDWIEKFLGNGAFLPLGVEGGPQSAFSRRSLERRHFWGLLPNLLFPSSLAIPFRLSTVSQRVWETRKDELGEAHPLSLLEGYPFKLPLMSLFREVDLFDAYGWGKGIGSHPFFLKLLMRVGNFIPLPPSDNALPGDQKKQEQRERAEKQWVLDGGAFHEIFSLSSFPFFFFLLNEGNAQRTLRAKDRQIAGSYLSSPNRFSAFPGALLLRTLDNMLRLVDDETLKIITENKLTEYPGTIFALCNSPLVGLMTDLLEESGKKGAIEQRKFVYSVLKGIADRINRGAALVEEVSNLQKNLLVARDLFAQRKAADLKEMERVRMKSNLGSHYMMYGLDLEQSLSRGCAKNLSRTPASLSHALCSIKRPESEGLAFFDFLINPAREIDWALADCGLLVPQILQLSSNSRDSAFGGQVRTSIIGRERKGMVADLAGQLMNYELGSLLKRDLRGVPIPIFSNDPNLSGWATTLKTALPLPYGYLEKVIRLSSSWEVDFSHELLDVLDEVLEEEKTLPREKLIPPSKENKDFRFTLSYPLSLLPPGFQRGKGNLVKSLSGLMNLRERLDRLGVLRSDSYAEIERIPLPVSPFGSSLGPGGNQPVPEARKGMDLVSLVRRWKKAMPGLSATKLCLLLERALGLTLSVPLYRFPTLSAAYWQSFPNPYDKIYPCAPKHLRDELLTGLPASGANKVNLWDLFGSRELLDHTSLNEQRAEKLEELEIEGIKYFYSSALRELKNLGWGDNHALQLFPHLLVLPELSRKLAGFHSLPTADRRARTLLKVIENMSPNQKRILRENISTIQTYYGITEADIAYLQGVCSLLEKKYGKLPYLDRRLLFFRLSLPISLARKNPEFLPKNPFDSKALKKAVGLYIREFHRRKVELGEVAKILKEEEGLRELEELEEGLKESWPPLGGGFEEEEWVE